MKILIVCTGNTCRSPMAEGVLRDAFNKLGYDENKVQVVSAGITAQNGLPANEKAVKVLKDQGIDISEHESRQLSIALVRESDLILAMTRNHKHIIATMIPDAAAKTFTLKEFAMGNLDSEDILEQLGTMYTISDEKRDELEKAREDKINSLEERKGKLEKELELIEGELEILKRKNSHSEKVDLSKIKAIENKLRDLDIEDPYGKSESAYKNTSEEIINIMNNIVKKIIEEQSK
jgi:protein-tyrosine phosphatase